MGSQYKIFTNGPIDPALTCPISELPEDVLISIFSIVIEGCDITLPEQLSRVCHRWQGIIYNYPMFWTKIRAVVPATQLPYDATWIKAILKRSAFLPISLETNRIEVLLKIELKQRFQSLTVTDWPILSDSENVTQLRTHLQMMLHEPSPDIESFSFTGRRARDGSYFGISSLFSGKAPNIREISLSTCVIKIEMLQAAARNLRTLDITRIDPKPTLTQWKSFLSKCAHLETLSLSDCFEFTDTFDNRSTTTVELPQLQSLHVNGYMRQCNLMTNNLSLAGTCKISLLCSGIPDIWNGLNDKMVTFMSSLTEQGQKNITLWFKFYVSAFTVSILSQDEQSLASFSFDWHSVVRWSHCFLNLVPFLTTLCALSESISTFRIECYFGPIGQRMPSEINEDMIRLLQLLENVHRLEGHISYIVYILQTPQERSGCYDAAVSKPGLPNLKSLSTRTHKLQSDDLPVIQSFVGLRKAQGRDIDFIDVRINYEDTTMTTAAALFGLR
ncbi:hypothetical protein BDQ17DRAFT_1421884 [Cyathus striatus]|nr:hypothetical protein BDQ17DRAFT_1421884 [Cyathus striatus]